MSKLEVDPIKYLKREMKQTRNEIIAAINKTFGERIQHLEDQMAFLNRCLEEHINHHLPRHPLQIN